MLCATGVVLAAKPRALSAGRKAVGVQHPLIQAANLRS